MDGSVAEGVAAVTSRREEQSLLYRLLASQDVVCKLMKKTQREVSMRAPPCIKDQRRDARRRPTHVPAPYLKDLGMQCELRVIRAECVGDDGLRRNGACDSKHKYCDSSMTEAEASNEAEHAKVYYEHAETNDDDYLAVLEECMHVHG